MINDIKQYFNFKDRLDHPIIMEKIVDGRVVDSKVIEAKKYINFIPFVLTFLYPIFTRKYRAKGFASDMWLLFGLNVLLTIIVSYVGEYLLKIPYALGTRVLNILQCSMFGLMFMSWFRDRLIKNGYTIRQEQEVGIKQESSGTTNGTVKANRPLDIVQPTNKENGIYCANCGAWNPNGKDSKFCMNCGAPLEHSERFVNSQVKPKTKKWPYILSGIIGVMVVTLGTFKLWEPLIMNFNKPYESTKHIEKEASSMDDDVASASKEKESTADESSEALESSSREESESNSTSKSNENIEQKEPSQVFREFENSSTFKDGIADIASSGPDRDAGAVSIQLLKDSASDSYLFNTNGHSVYILEASAGDAKEKYEMNAETGDVLPMEGGPYDIPNYTLGERSIIPFDRAINKNY